MKTLNAALLKCLNQGNVDTNLVTSRFLFDYRNTPHCTMGVAPASLMFGRRLRTRFDLILPEGNTSKIKNYVLTKQEKQSLYFKGKNVIEFSLGELVLVKDYRVINKVSRIKGRVIKRIGKNTYLVEIPEVERT